jgi:hypothetical protein
MFFCCCIVHIYIYLHILLNKTTPKRICRPKITQFTDTSTHSPLPITTRGNVLFHFYAERIKCFSDVGMENENVHNALNTIICDNMAGWMTNTFIPKGEILTLRYVLDIFSAVSVLLSFAKKKPSPSF